jgi:hypothetical protein
MKSENITAGRLQKVTTGWTQGVNSVRNPWALPENQFKWGTNLTIRGGIAQTRPGYAMRLSLPPGNLQGGIIFQANKQKESAFTREERGVTTVVPAKIFNVEGEGVVKNELSYMVFAVDGSVYYAPFPLEQPKNWNDFKLKNIKLDKDVENVYFALATKTANLATSENELVTPAHTIVMVQDGISAPGWWDGSDKNGFQDSNIPVGTHMAYSGNRMWIADKNIVLASDLGDPTSWKERTEGTGRGDFAFVRPVTGMVSYVGQDTSTRLIVFTDRATYSLASGILDRTQWVTTANFQNTLYPTVGCIAARSIAFQAGQMWWYSEGGLVAADVAAASYLSSQVLFKDIEMARTKRLMDGDASNICATSFENYLLYSVPHLSKLNTDTMVLDYAPAAEWGQARTPAWCGVWTGTRPVQWANGKIENQNRCFQFSIDYAPTTDGSYNHLWEAFQPERYDSYLQLNPDGTSTTLYNRIYCQYESPLLGDGMDLKQFIYSEIEAMEIGGTVDVRVSYRGSKGRYLPILNTRLLAVTNDFQYKGTDFEEQIKKVGFLNTQYRRLITESTNRLQSYETCESSLTNDVDKAFSVLIEWCGEMGIEIVRMFMDPWSEKATGVPQLSETESCVVGQNGENFTVDLAPSPYENTFLNQVTWSAKVFKTATLNCNASSRTISATASASFISTVSYAHAKEEAEKLAEQAAIAAAQEFKANNPC